jgi:predicted metal-dependent peptidase
MSKKVVKIVRPRTKDLDPRIIAQAKKRLEWVIGFMIIRYHFVYQILSMMTKEVVPGFGTMGVWVQSGGSFHLSCDPEFIDELSDEALTYVLYHEILHLALHHCTSRKFDNHFIGNIATDLAVNELIPINPGSCEPPKDSDGSLSGTFVSEFQKMPQYKDILEKQTAEWYYDFIMKKKPIPTSENAFDNHGSWKEDEVADEKVRAKIDEIVKNNLWGNVGASEKELITAAQSRRVNWRNILRQFYGNQVWPEREGTRKRPNRRTGYVHPGSRKIQLDRHLVAVDTSGSVEKDLLSQFLATINQMTDFVPIDVMQCDCGVTDTPQPFDRKKHQYEFKGGGGTDFQPIMDIVTERRYKSVVILTDGAASECTKPPARVVWVLPEGLKPPVPWGQRIHMSRHV